MTLPSLPKGIDRDSTVHGKLYFTKAQMLAYGALCRGDDAEEKREPIQYADHEYNGDFGAFIRGFGKGGKK